MWPMESGRKSRAFLPFWVLLVLVSLQFLSPFSVAAQTTDQAKIARLGELLMRAEERLKNLESIISKLEAESTLREQELTGLREERAALQTEVELLRQDLAESKKANSEAKDSWIKENESLEDLRTTFPKLDGFLMNLEADLSRERKNNGLYLGIGAVAGVIGTVLLVMMVNAHMGAP